MSCVCVCMYIYIYIYIYVYVNKRLLLLLHNTLKKKIPLAKRGTLVGRAV